MNIQELLAKPLWQMTGEEFLFLQQYGNPVEPQVKTVTVATMRYVYGLRGVAELFGCSLPTANRIKQSGRIDKAVTQIGRKIIVDADLALELAGHKIGGRRNKSR